MSPEYIFAGMMGMPDQRGFGVFWVPREELAAACDMDGAFNRLAVKLAPGASERTVIDPWSNQLARYGGREAHGREDQPSHAMLDNEIKEQRRTLFERLGITRMGPALRMILRNMERRPLRTSLSIAGVAASVAIVVMGNFFRDAIDYIVDSQFAGGRPSC